MRNCAFILVFDGNGYTISNIEIKGNDYVAMFGYNEGIIRGLNIQNISVTGNQYVAGIGSGTLIYNVVNTYGIVESGTYENNLGFSSYSKMAYINGKVTTKSYPYFMKMVESSYNNISAYNDYIRTILDWTNEDGYYFDYNSDGTDIIVKR